MFAYVHFNLDKQYAKLPVSYIKNFDPTNYDSLKPYKVFWNRDIQALQKIEDPLQREKLIALQEPPQKSERNPELGDGYYWAYVLRVENTLDELATSIVNKRPTLRPSQTVQIVDEILTSTEDENTTFGEEKSTKRFEEAEIKKKEKESKKVKANSIFKAAKRARNDTFEKLNLNDNTDLENVEYPDPPSYSMKKNIKRLEKENQNIRKDYEEMEVKYFDLKTKFNSLKAEVEEIGELRSLNRQLQEQILKGGFSTTAMPVEMPVVTEPDATEVNLGANISLDRKVYEEIFALDNVRKFTKSLAVAVWGTEVLAGRSVKGRACRNKNGPKKITDPSQTCRTNETKPPLTPEKLSVISDQMRKYLAKKGVSSIDSEKEIKKRNKYVSDKIQDILANKSRSIK